MFNKLELCKKAEAYFKKPGVDLMYATTDSQFFHAHSKQYADGHASTQRGVTVVVINRGDLKTELALEEQRNKEREATAKAEAKAAAAAEGKLLGKMNLEELQAEVEALKGISKDDIEMVMGLSPKSKIVSFIESYEAPKPE